MTEKLVFRITPLDVLMFRDGRPFNLSTSFASSLNFPYPSTFSGALRKLFGDLLKINTKDWNNILGDATKSPLLFSGPFLEKDKEIYVNVPKIFLVEKKEEGAKNPKGLLKSFHKIAGDDHFLNLKSSTTKVKDPFWNVEEAPLEPASGFVKATQLIEIIDGKKIYEELEIFPWSDFFFEDVRTHIRTEGKTVAEEGGKFSVRYIGLKEGVSFVMEVEKYEFSMWSELLNVLPEKAIVKLGGEGRQVIFEKVKETSKTFEVLNKLREMEKAPSNARILITPLAFEKETFNPVSAVTSKASIMRGRNYKGMSKFLGVYEAGSVFVFDDRDFERIKNEEWFLNFRSLGYNMSVKGGAIL